MHKIGSLFDSRSQKQRELVLITNAQNQKNFWNHGNGFWQESDLKELEKVIQNEFEFADGTSVKINAFAVNKPCPISDRGHFPEDCSFPEVLKRLDPGWNQNQIIMNQNINQEAEIITRRVASAALKTPDCWKKDQPIDRVSIFLNSHVVGKDSSETLNLFF